MQELAATSGMKRLHISMSSIIVWISNSQIRVRLTIKVHFLKRLLSVIGHFSGQSPFIGRNVKIDARKELPPRQERGRGVNKTDLVDPDPRDWIRKH